MPATPRKVVLAVDLGTSGPKVALVSTGGAVLGHEFEPVELLLLPGGGAEQRPSGGPRCNPGLWRHVEP